MIPEEITEYIKDRKLTLHHCSRKGLIFSSTKYPEIIYVICPFKWNIIRYLKKSYVQTLGYGMDLSAKCSYEDVYDILLFYLKYKSKITLIRVYPKQVHIYYEKYTYSAKINIKSKRKYINYNFPDSINFAKKIVEEYASVNFYERMENTFTERFKK